MSVGHAKVARAEFASLGTTPAHWAHSKLRGLLKRVTVRNRPDLPLLSVVRDKGVIPRDRSSEDENHNFIPDDLTNYKVVRRGQFAMNKMKAWQGSYGVSDHEGIVSPAYFVFDLQGVDPRFFHLAVRSRAYVPFFAQASDGVRIGQWDLADARMREIPFLIPPAAEQTAIVRFLDYSDLKIREYIGAKQKLIDLLEEQQEVIVHRAVTRGLDKDASLKPSGSQWLGEIPSHWHVEPLRRRWTVKDCKHLTVPFVDDGVPLASVREVQSFELQLDRAKRTTPYWYQVLSSGDRRPRRGDLVYCRNVSVGAAAVVETDEQFAMGQDVCLIRSKNQNQRFLNYFLRSPAMKRQLALVMVGSTFDRINVADVKSLLVPVPPRFEQDRIAAALDTQLAKIIKAVSRCKSEQVLLREYRERLFADVVTGKLDVREAAAALPELDPSEPLAESADDVQFAELDGERMATEEAEV